jgi:protein-tyrosine phosphatase
MIDLHAHVLPGIDDGPGTLDDSLALLQALVADGVTTVCATPHVQPGYPTTPAERDAALERVRAAARAAGLAIKVEQGGEVDIEYAAQWGDDEVSAFTLAGGGALLIEFPWTATWPLALIPTCRALRLRGFLPVIAHPERVRAAQAAPQKLDEAIASGAVAQVTTGSLTGRFGETAQRTAFDLVRARRAHVVATDTHDTVSRPPEVRAARVALAAAVGEDLAEALFAAPADVIAGLVPRLPPATEPRRRGLFRR